MVRKRIAANPKKSPELPPDADKWANSGGVDPEIVKSNVEPVPPQKTTAPIEPPATKPYPHRVSFDMATEQYKRLKRASAEELRSLNEILRDATENWLTERHY